MSARHRRTTTGPCRALVAAAVALGLTALGPAGLVPAPPAAADPVSDLLTGVSGALTGPAAGGTAPGQSAAPTAAQFASWGSFSAPTYRLARGCHDYAYRYAVTPPEPDWALEVFLTDRRGRAIGSEIMMSGGNPPSAVRHWRICRSATVPGVFTIRGVLTYNDYPEQYSGAVTPTQFRMTPAKPKKCAKPKWRKQHPRRCR